MAFSQYRGVPISLISKSGIRYCGVLDDINPSTSSISLTNVRSYGTEGRKGNPLEEIPPQDTIFGYITFRAQDVLDLQVQNEQPPPPATPQLQDPAIITYQTSAPSSQGPSGPAGDNAPRPKSPAPELRGKVIAEPEAAPHGPRSDQADHQNRHENEQGAGHGRHHRGHGAQRGARSGGARGPRQPSTGSQQAGPSVPKEEFDFEGANAKFHKEDLIKEFAKLGIRGAEADSQIDAEHEEPNVPAPQEFYNQKSSFFDNISCEAKERLAMERSGLDYQQRRARMAQERKLNVETFGTSSVDRRGHGWRGGRGYRGRRRNNSNRGGHNNENDREPRDGPRNV